LFGFVTFGAFAVALLTAMACASTATSRSPRGVELFLGREPLKGTIRGHEASLPPEFVACGSCHGAAHVQSPAGTYAPPLVSSWLREPRVRRGGPPSSYDLPSFCRLLRTGVDPASILIARIMPTYEIDDTQCSNLWTFVTNAP
jgi:hypothetical protein